MAFDGISPSQTNILPKLTQKVVTQDQIDQGLDWLKKQIGKGNQYLPGQPWCAALSTKFIEKSGIAYDDLLGRSGDSYRNYVPDMKKAAEQKDIFVPRNKADGKNGDLHVGDRAVFDWTNPKTGRRDGTPDHTSVVTKVIKDKKGRITGFETIGGNESGRVRYKTEGHGAYSLTNGDVMGFIKTKGVALGGTDRDFSKSNVIKETTFKKSNTYEHGNTGNGNNDITFSGKNNVFNLNGGKGTDTFTFDGKNASGKVVVGTPGKNGTKDTVNIQKGTVKKGETFKVTAGKSDTVNLTGTGWKKTGATDKTTTYTDTKGGGGKVQVSKGATVKPNAPKPSKKATTT